MPVMNLFLRAIFTVEAVFSCVILGQYFAEELRAIRVSDRSSEIGFRGMSAVRATASTCRQNCSQLSLLTPTRSALDRRLEDSLGGS
jgi:hypothetical protein